MSEAIDLTAMKSLLERIVGFDTQNPPGRESEAAQAIRHELEAMGCRSELVLFGDGRANAIGVFENGPGPSFAFNTHIDVVPASGGWSSDPFRLREEGGRLFGRGACDAKGPLVAMLDAMRRLIAAKDGWSGTLIGAFVADEEVGSLGARDYVKTAPALDYCVIGEPTSCGAVTAHKGSIRPVVRIHGKSAHSGTPDLGVNAAIKAASLLQAVVGEHERVRGFSHDLCGSASLTVVSVHGGVADNVVPEYCDVTLDRRMVPGEEEAQVMRDLERLIDAAARDAGTTAEIVGFRPSTGAATETPRDHPMVHAAQHCCARHNGVETPLGGFQGGCDLVHFRALGAQGVVIGPGSLAVAHKPDEFVPVDELARASLIYSDLALAMLASRSAERLNLSDRS